MRSVDDIIVQARIFWFFSHILFLLMVPLSIWVVWDLFWPSNPISYMQSVALYVLLVATNSGLLRWKK